MIFIIFEINVKCRVTWYIIIHNVSWVSSLTLTFIGHGARQMYTWANVPGWTYMSPNLQIIYNSYWTKRCDLSANSNKWNMFQWSQISSRNGWQQILIVQKHWQPENLQLYNAKPIPLHVLGIISFSFLRVESKSICNVHGMINTWTGTVSSRF